MKHEFNYSIDEIDTVAEKVITLSPNKTILFKGNLGAGKTTFVQALVKALKSKDMVSSPTFGLVNEYLSPESKIYHFDCYRLEVIDEALDFGIEENLDSNAWIFIEWPEIIEPLLPQKITQIKINFRSKTERTLELEY